MFFFKVFAWASRMQLWQPCQIDLPEGRKVSLLVQKRSYQKNIFVKKRFFLEIIPWTGIKQISQHFLKFFPKGGKTVSSETYVCRKRSQGHVKSSFNFHVGKVDKSLKTLLSFSKDDQKHKIFRRKVSSKLSHGHVESIFHSTFWKLFPECRKLSSQGPKKTKGKKFSKKQKKGFSSKCSSGHVKCKFDNPVEIFSRGSRKFFAQNPKQLKNHETLNFFYCSSFSGYLQCSFDKPSKKIRQKPEKFSLNVQNDEENFEEKNSLQMVFRTRRRQIEKLSWKKSNRKPKNFLIRLINFRLRSRNYRNTKTFCLVK